MISNEWQYQAKKQTIRMFEESLAHADDQGADWDPVLRDALARGIASDIAHMRDELQEYEDFRAGKVRELTIDRLDELPDVLIRARIASGWTQRELAAELGLKEQQIQRYEATRYKSASLTRLLAVAEALDIKVQLRATLPDPAEFRARNAEIDANYQALLARMNTAFPDAAPAAPPEAQVA